MSVNSYLTNLATNLIIRDSEKESIKISNSTLETRLKSYFGNEIGFVSIFGSYQRNTILPREYDIYSDIDVMVLFGDTSFKPQTYLNKLRRFAESRYRTSEIYQSSPTIVLKLNHIKFELVPSLFAEYYASDKYKIPSKANSYEDWLYTSPFEFSDTVTAKNKEHGNYIKPLIRIMKRWNRINSGVYESFELEQMIINNGFYSCLFDINANLWSYFYNFVSSLNTSSLAYQYQKDAVSKLKNKVNEVKNHETSYPSIAENIISSIFD